jgi:hypothetical protein
MGWRPLRRNAPMIKSGECAAYTARRRASRRACRTSPSVLGHRSKMARVSSRFKMALQPRSRG